MRARYPDTSGFVDRGGVKIGYEMFGDGAPALVFAPLTRSLIPSRGKLRCPTLPAIPCDHHRPSGQRTFRPAGVTEAYADTEYAADTIAVMDACQVDRAVIVGLRQVAGFSLLMAALYPDRVLGVVAIAAAVPYLAPLPAALTEYDFDEMLDTDEGWAKQNRHYWLRDWRGYAEFFVGELFCEPHSTKPREDGVGFAMETSAETMLAREDAPMASSSAGGNRAVAPPGALPGTGDPRGSGPLRAGVVERADRRADWGRTADHGGRGTLPRTPGSRWP